MCRPDEARRMRAALVSAEEDDPGDPV